MRGTQILADKRRVFDSISAAINSQLVGQVSYLPLAWRLAVGANSIAPGRARQFVGQVSYLPLAKVP